MPVIFEVNGKNTKQALYVCDRVERLYFSQIACIDVGILHTDFPFPISDLCKLTECSTSSTPTNPVSPSSCYQLPTRPLQLPFPADPKSIDNLKDWLVKAFKETAFNKEGKFPVMTGPPAKIHLKEGAMPKARHTPSQYLFT